jgi:MFS family permease
VTGSKVSMAIEAPAEPVVAPQPASRRGWYAVIMLSIVAIMSQIDRGILALFVQPMKRDLGLTDTQVSILLGFAFTFFYVVGGPPLARMADRGVRKSVISGCLAAWSIATAVCGIAQSFWAFFAARAVIGGSESGCGPASLSMIADSVPRERLPRAYAMYNSGFVGGAALSLVVGGVLIGLLAHVRPIELAGIGVIYNWQLVFMMLGIPGLLIAVLVLTTVPEPLRKGGRKPDGYPVREVFRFVVSQRALHLPFLAGVLLLSFQTYGLAAWMPAFYERTYGWGPAVVGPLLGVVTLTSSVIGLFGGARLAEWLSRRHDDANMRTLFLAQLLAVPLGVIGPLMPNPWLALACGAITTMFSVLGAPAYNAAIQLSTPNEMRSQINVMYFILSNAVAGSLGPTVVALVTDYVAHSEADLRYVLAGVRLVAGPLCAFFLWRAVVPYGRVYRQRLEENGE